MPRGSTATALGSGSAAAGPAPIRSVAAREVGPLTVVEAGPYEVRLLRTTAPALGPSDAGTLTVAWPGGGPTTLVGLRSR